MYLELLSRWSGGITILISVKPKKKEHLEKNQESDVDEIEKKDLFKEINIAYTSLPDKKKFMQSVLIPLILLGGVISFLPIVFPLIGLSFL
jgi:hypothetical protein